MGFYVFFFICFDWCRFGWETKCKEIGTSKNAYNYIGDFGCKEKVINVTTTPNVCRLCRLCVCAGCILEVVVVIDI